MIHMMRLRFLRNCGNVTSKMLSEFKFKFLGVLYPPLRFTHESTNIPVLEPSNSDTDYSELSYEYLNPCSNGHGVLILQPYVKWGVKKKRNTTPALQLAEAKALIRTLPNWIVVDSMCISLLSLRTKKLLGKGNLEMLCQRVKMNPNITALFVSVNLLRHIQTSELQDLLGIPVYDRYAIVIHIFREHAKTSEAKLQVALAEVPYIWKKIGSAEDDCNGRINLSDRRRMLLHARESKLRSALNQLKEHRKMIRSSRAFQNIPTVAVVGYTNAGKTCLIKALTNDESLTPENKLFATLDTTVYEGLLPCRLKCLYVDTIGFIQDIPDDLIAPFIATFEDAMNADVIVHVYDASHPDNKAQIDCVRQTLADITLKLNIDSKPIIEVANKCDLGLKDGVPEDILPVSAIHSTGIHLLQMEIEKKLLTVTNRRAMKIRVRSGSVTAAWLYKEMTVNDAEVDPNDPQYLLLSVITTDSQIHRFRKFLKK